MKLFDEFSFFFLCLCVVRIDASSKAFVWHAHSAKALFSFCFFSISFWCSLRRSSKRRPVVPMYLLPRFVSDGKSYVVIFCSFRQPFRQRTDICHRLECLFRGCRCLFIRSVCLLVFHLLINLFIRLTG